MNRNDFPVTCVESESMRAAVLLDLDDVDFIEPNFERLTDNSYNNQLLTLPAKQAKLLISEDEWPLALAVSDGKTWKAGSFLLRKPTEAVIERAEELEAEILQEERHEWETAVRELFSLRIAREVLPAIEDFTPKRAVLVEEAAPSGLGGRRRRNVHRRVLWLRCRHGRFEASRNHPPQLRQRSCPSFARSSFRPIGAGGHCLPGWNEGQRIFAAHPTRHDSHGRRDIPAQPDILA